MSLVLIILLIVVLCGGGWGWNHYGQPGGPYLGGGLVGIVLIILLVWFLFGSGGLYVR